MRLEHDTRPCTPWAHSAYRGYDAFVGKIESFHGLAYACHLCDRRFISDEARTQHHKAKHSGEGA